MSKFCLGIHLIKSISLKTINKHTNTHTHIIILMATQTIKRMATFIKAELKKSDNQANIERYIVAANRIPYFMKINLLRIMIIKLLFHVQNACNIKS